MPLLQVKDCPASIYEELRECAAKEHRSISQQTLHIIESYLAEWRAGIPAHEPAPAAPARRCSYATDPHDTTDYLAKRRRIFAEIAQMEPIPITDDCPSTAEILRIAREEDAR